MVNPIALKQKETLKTRFALLDENAPAGGTNTSAKITITPEARLNQAESDWSKLFFYEPQPTNIITIVGARTVPLINNLFAVLIPEKNAQSTWMFGFADKSSLISLESFEFEQVISVKTPYDFLRNFAAHASAFVEQKGIRLINSKIRDWQSVEDPTWKQQVLELTIESEPEIALVIWDQLGEMLQELINREFEHFQQVLREGISLTIKWVPGGHI